MVRPGTTDPHTDPDRYDAEIECSRTLCARCGVVVHRHWTLTVNGQPNFGACEQPVNEEIEEAIGRLVHKRVIAKLRGESGSGETMFYLKTKMGPISISKTSHYRFGFTGFQVTKGKCQSATITYSNPLYQAVPALIYPQFTDSAIAPDWLSPLLPDPPDVSVVQLHPLVWLRLTGRTRDPRRIDPVHMRSFRPTSKVNVYLFDGSQTRCTFRVETTIPLHSSHPIDRVIASVRRLLHSLPKRTEDCRFWADQQARLPYGPLMGRHYVGGIQTSLMTPLSELSLPTTTGYQDYWTQWRNVGGNWLFSSLWTLHRQSTQDV